MLPLARKRQSNFPYFLRQRYTKSLVALIVIMLVIACNSSFAQLPDSTQKEMKFSGSIGITNNAFSIIPLFSLNSPSAVFLLSWRKNRFSIEPDIRLSLDGKKGNMLFWFRYRLIDKQKFSLRVGTHPAYNFALREVTENGVTSEITQARRFIASEVVPNYQITPNWSVGMYYLQGNGLQKDGPRLSHFVTLNTSISNIKLGPNFRFQFVPEVYYLNLDGDAGTYFTTTGILSRKKVPFTLQSTINQTFSSTIPGNKEFLWNVTLSYNFSQDFVRKQPAVLLP
ncbi:hypothetical protein [Pontibacter saemangeumensis]|uniref:hypothetical protein n=1 Tax=Pontibacter saemangeumensis TaxID=1084525 RepID=UPI0031F1388D